MGARYTAGPFDDFSVAGVRNSWNKTSERVDQIQRAPSLRFADLIESMCKNIVDRAGEHYGDLDNIYQQASRSLELPLDQKAEQAFRQLSGACDSIVGSMSEIRNRFGDVHGRGGADDVPLSRHAELAVNVAGSLAIFLIRTKV